MVREVPFSVAVTWPQPNTVDPEFRGNINLIVNIVLLSIVIPFVVLRLYTRHYMRHWLGWDDFFCVLGLILTIGFSVAVIINCYSYKAGRHVWDIPLSTFQSGLKTAMACKFLFTLAGTAIRQSLLCFYLRLLGDAGIRWFHWIIHGTSAINICAGIAFAIMSIVECVPVSAYWRYPSSAFGKCIAEGPKTLSAGIILVAIDFVTVLLPIPIIVRLQMSWKSKFGVICLLSMGLAASAAAAVRCYFIWKSLIDSYDVSWWVSPLYVAAAVELNVALLCSCLPAVRPFMSTYMPWITKPLSWVGRLRDYTRVKYHKDGTSASCPDDATAASAPDGRASSTRKKQVNDPEARYEMDAKYGPNFLLEATRASSHDGLVDVSSTLYSVSRRGGGMAAYGSEEHLRAESAQSIDKEQVLSAVTRAIRGVGIQDEPIPESFNISRGNSRTNSRATSRIHSRSNSFTQKPSAHDHEPIPAVPSVPTIASRSGSRDGSRKASFEVAVQSRFAVDRTPSRTSAHTAHDEQARSKKSSETHRYQSPEGRRSPLIDAGKAASGASRTNSTKEADQRAVQSGPPGDLFGYGSRQTHAAIGSIRPTNRDVSPAEQPTRPQQDPEREDTVSEGWAQWRRTSKKLEKQGSRETEHANSHARRRSSGGPPTGPPRWPDRGEPDSEEGDPQSPWHTYRAKDGSSKQPRAPKAALPRHPRYTAPLDFDASVQSRYVNFSQPRPSSARAPSGATFHLQTRPLTQAGGESQTPEWGAHRPQQDSVGSGAQTFFLDESRETSEAGNLE